MSKVKMRCISCGKWFQSANAKEVTCPECTQKARKEKMASKAAPPAAQKTPGQGLPGAGSSGRPVAPPPKPKPAASSSRWFDSLSDVKVSEPEPPPQRPRLPSSPAPRDTAGGPGSYRGPGAYRNAPMSGSIVGGIGQRPRLPMEGSTPPRGPRPASPGERRLEKYNAEGRRGSKPPVAQKKLRPAIPSKPKREKIPPPQPFKPTPEQIAQVEARYKELAVPAEFDGIRSQIAHELAIPKKAVKQIVKELREREHLPSWWETQTYKGDEEEKARIKAAYDPYLPVPPVGIHRKIADELDLKPGIVYQAIKTIRSEMGLPPYNDPELHAAEFEEIKRKAREAKEAREAAKAALATQASETGSEPQGTREETPNVQAVTATNEGEQVTE